MVVRKLLTWPDPRLKQEAQPVEKINNNIEKTWLDLTDTMEALSCDKMIIKSSYKMRLPNLKTFQSDEMKFYY